ncbi:MULTISPECIES: undecaprenyl diphosphate synthase family protein [Methanosarcina]|jgi:undecaprenyl diphosphate synthase|uniref:Undecaprenyl diphosphate synthase n=1 Tax=Methanosarcina vacuolata Z-761 TaxID=1434123 RepID=A0A0E3Q077_9EURY|nr:MULTISPECIES: undecaprenyl diphosphate synthase family protein [Methanosarcina]AKB42470.1 Undecaprenyl diphosphate synthase [Methanosarcina vacuolata Z-761]MCC4766829.1 UDP diphosphate synthase [Methanosarcina sp. DH1]
MDLLSFAYPVYERYLTWQIAREFSNIPRHVAIILKETDLFDPEGIDRLISTLNIFRKFKVKIVSVYVDILNTDPALKAEVSSTLKAKLEKVFSNLPACTGYRIYGVDGEVNNTAPGNDFLVYVSLGFGGRDEITKAVLTILAEVKEGTVRPEEVDEKMIESHLLVHHEPDIMIRSGGQNLSDFLVWQSVYSELYFTDVNWRDVRKVDLLRAMRDFQKRKRRYGR